MDSDVARRAHALFKRAVDLPAAERAGFLADACRQDAALRARLDGLLSAMGNAEAFLATPALAACPEAAAAQDDTLIDAPHRDRYVLLRVLGTGGMATVYEAEQEEPRRRVAVKIMRQGLLETSAISRFKFETEVLARLNHPNIAQIYETGTWHRDDGHATPYFAMEFVRQARDITQYAREQRLSLARKLAMFTDVCDAVQHGHQLGVIHRDLKPGNILVDVHGRAKVIDFGVARSTDPRKALITLDADTRQIIGTLNYMSPEQCSGSSHIDMRTDVYALGVVLYEMLCGRRPYDLSGVPLPEAVRVIRQEMPPRPATLNPALRGDLDAIVLTAMEKEPDRRYRTAAALAADVRRFLRHEPVEARPPTLVYQLSRFTRRNRTLVAASLLVLVSLVAGGAVSTLFGVRAVAEARQRRAAEVTALAERDTALRSAYAASMAAGFAAYQAGELQQVRYQLAAAPEALRGWEWRLLRNLSERSLHTLQAHPDIVFDMAMTHAGDRLATAGRDGSVRVWDTDSNRMLAELPSPGLPALCVTFDPGGTHLAAGYLDGSVRIWHVGSGSLVYEGRPHTTTVQRLAWLPKGLLASACSAGVGLVWEPTTGRVIAELSKPQPPPVHTDTTAAVHGLTTDKHGTLLMTWNNAGVVRLHDATTLALRHTMPFDGPVRSGAVSDDATHLAAGGEMGRVLVWDVTESAPARPPVEVLRHDGGVSWVRSVRFSPDAGVLAASVVSRQVRLFPLQAANVRPAHEPAEVLAGHEDAISALHFSPDGRRLYSASWDSTMRTWAVADGMQADFVCTLRSHTGHVLAAAFARDSSFIATGGRDDVIRVWDPATGEARRTLTGHTADVAGLAVSPDGGLLASASYDGTIGLWDTTAWRQTASLHDHEGAVWSVAFSPDGRRLASGGMSPAVRVWDVAGGQVLHRLAGHRQRVNHVAFSPDARHIASASRDHDVRLWHADTGEQRHLLSGHRLDVFAVQFSQDGKLLYSGSRDRTVRVWDVASGTCLAVLDGHGQLVTSLALSPDGTRLAAGSWFGEVVIWETGRWQVVASFNAQSEAIRCLAFSPEGRWLAVGSYNGTVRLLDDTSPEQRAATRQAGALRQQIHISTAMAARRY
ncbi:MAG: serine/threonine-protein kinase [Phycisphaerae bacterium]